MFFFFSISIEIIKHGAHLSLTQHDIRWTQDLCFHNAANCSKTTTQDGPCFALKAAFGGFTYRKNLSELILYSEQYIFSGCTDLTHTHTNTHRHSHILQCCIALRRIRNIIHWAYATKQTAEKASGHLTRFEYSIVFFTH